MTAPGRDTAMPTLAYGILALLAREPLTGYEMSRLLRGSHRPLLAGPPQPDLPDALAPRAGWLDDLAAGTRAGSATDEPSRDNRHRAGRASSVGGVAAGPQEQSGRAPPARLRVLGRGRADHHRDPARSRSAARQAASGIPLRRDRTVASGGPGPARSAGFADYATLRRGIGFERGRLAWVRWLIQQIEDDPEQDTGRR